MVRTSADAASAALKRLHDIHPDVMSSCIRKKPVLICNPQYDLDVIVPIYNAGQFLRPCLDSIFSQKTKYSYRVICVDDGSSDDSGRILDEEYSSKSNALVIHQENRGHSGARNRALDDLNSRYVTFIDSDDRLPSDDVFEAMLDVGLGKDYSLVGGGYDRISEDGTFLSFTRHVSGEVVSCSGHTGFPWGKLIRSSIFRDIVFPEGYWFEDSLMRQIVFERVDKAWYIDKDVYQYRCNPLSVTHTHQGKPKSIDSLYVTLSLWRDRRALGIPEDEEYQEYLLHMARLIRVRVGGLSEAVKRDVFTVYSAFYTGLYKDNTPRKNKALHKALVTGDYGKYRVNLA